MTLLVTEPTLASKLTGWSCRTLSNRVALLFAMMAFQDTRVRAVGLVVTKQVDENEPVSFDALGYGLPFLATIEATIAATSGSASIDIGTLIKSSGFITAVKAVSTVILGVAAVGPSVTGSGVIPLGRSIAARTPVISRWSPVTHVGQRWNLEIVSMIYTQPRRKVHT